MADDDVSCRGTGGEKARWGRGARCREGAVSTGRPSDRGRPCANASWSSGWARPARSTAIWWCPRAPGVWWCSCDGSGSSRRSPRNAGGRGAPATPGPRDAAVRPPDRGRGVGRSRPRSSPVRHRLAGAARRAHGQRRPRRRRDPCAPRRALRCEHRGGGGPRRPRAAIRHRSRRWSRTRGPSRPRAGRASSRCRRRRC